MHALSPLDGRYKKKVTSLSEYFSEFGLMKYRLKVEVEYLLFLSKKNISNSISSKDTEFLKGLVTSFHDLQAEEVLQIERTIHHDVKAVEYFLREQMQRKKINGDQWIHFALTSEDTNSLAYGIALKDSLQEVFIPAIKKIIIKFAGLSKEYASIPMLARTHGQVAVPTTVGKEICVFATRLSREFQVLQNFTVEGKLTGAVGNFNAHVASFPKENWLKLSTEFVSSLGLQPQTTTTQILPADSYAHLFSSILLINSILTGFCQDMWRYISDDYFVLKLEKNQVGSSTMPQKINPIDFENAEGNLGLANSMLEFFIRKLPISRLQRDLSDSTVKRNIGVAFGHSLVAYDAIEKGLTKISLHEKKLQEELNEHWEVIAEGIQTILRSYGDTRAYEKVKDFSRGKRVTKESVAEFIDKLSVDKKTTNKLKKLSPYTFIGISEEIVEEALKEIEHIL